MAPAAEDVVVVPMTAQDWPHVERIYSAGIEAGHATFESTAPTWEQFDGSRLADHRLVAVAPDGAVGGWTACVAVSARPVYAGVVEHSVFVDPMYQGRGIGGLLLAVLIAQTEAAGIWTIQAHVFPENEASLRLHAQHGFRQVGTRRALGQVASAGGAAAWRDVVLIERRSATVGV